MSTTSLTAPPDIRAIRASIAPILSTDIPRADPFDPESRHAPEKHFVRAELVALTEAFRQHLQDLIPAVEAWAERLPEDHPDRLAARMCTGQARILLRAEPAETEALRGSVASRMARSVRTLCGHYDRLVPR
ncbi:MULTISPECIES: DUF6415 family natural product biosynthesis protein [unclassified Streptomyces]|uniref:DUF6415 family natural product biosynthesis protein n=1 Tax=unclassified Streptomyces TaxID=2593676 RepID=UPI0019098060|nr:MULTISPECIES: DUF6415 family natural product biosynthesis protein [unclassified Streptomyces]MBK3563239.1 hypothetical protein [Streptomyces sp. MBT62]MBK6013228.1 hypothetical protein [Streptomyces sp. MBT53]